MFTKNEIYQNIHPEKKNVNKRYSDLSYKIILTD